MQAYISWSLDFSQRLLNLGLRKKIYVALVFKAKKKQTSHTSIFFFFYADFSTFANGDKEPNTCFLGKFGPQTETIANNNANANGTNNAPEKWESFCAAGAHEHNRVSGTSCAAGRKSLRVLHCTVP
jgi:hypothetical protein